MTLDQILGFSSFLQLGFLAKIIIMVLALFYVVFTAVVYRQIDLMTQVLDSKISPVVKTIALIQIGAAVFVLVLAVLLA